MALKYQDIIDDMTLEEKARLCTGKNMWATYNVDRLSIPSIFTSDGPHGLRKQVGSDENNIGFVMGAPSTCFPPAATMANSWDEELGEEIGRALGEEAIGLDVNVLLGPGLNIKRSPLCGRNFEYYSEDPYLSGKMAASYVRGIQSQGVASCIKHFAANNQEYQRMCNNSVVDERTLREIYLTGFEIAVKEGGPLAIMASYNEVNGTYAFENPHLLKDILRDEWGFNGAVISDWGACDSIVNSIKAGGNLEMPGCGDVTVEEILQAVESGELSVRDIDDRISELLDVILWTNEFKNYRAVFSKDDDGDDSIILEERVDNNVDFDAHLELARKAARESIVLLKNDGELLPLKNDKKVAVIGQLAKKPRIQGGGSSIVTPKGEVKSVVDIIGEYDINNIGYAEGYELGDGIHISKEEEAVNLAKDADIVLLFAGLDDFSESEAFDREDYNIPSNQLSLIDKVCDVNDNVVMVLAGGSPFSMPWITRVKGILHGYLTGQEGAAAILDVLTGKFNPCGKLAETYPLRLDDVPCSKYYPGREKDVKYKEGLYVGYRYYDSTDTPVQFPFGFGLSYTKFQYSDIEADKDKVTFNITNVGDVAGHEISQLYIGREAASVYRVKKELKGFSKVFLEPGETKKVCIELDDKAFRIFDVNSMRWIVEPGTYNLYIASSVEDVRLSKSVEIGMSRAIIPNYYTGNVKEISDEEFERLYGKHILQRKDDTIGRNDSLQSLKNSKSFVGRMAVKFLESKFKSSKKDLKKKADYAGVLNMPIRGLNKLTGGSMNAKVVDSVVDIANGNTIKGWKAFFAERKKLKNKSKDKTDMGQ
ncbi:MAG: glycoside hydrolase family 3 C-terminal domain-containing protein [Lachnospiraceae bacterium]|nr:glycoside hydrolase family 3 C-terminal domain-containing protein [Lachnospiraceae bacterium]